MIMLDICYIVRNGRLREVGGGLNSILELVSFVFALLFLLYVVDIVLWVAFDSVGSFCYDLRFFTHFLGSVSFSSLLSLSLLII